MRTALNVVIILAVGLAIGLGMRFFQTPLPTSDQAVAEGEALERVVAVDAAAFDTADGEATDGEATDGDAPASASDSPATGESEWLTSFTLTERSGEQVSSESLQGQPYVASFFFSTCPSICVMQNQKIQQLQTEFEDQGVRFVGISVDPETDTPETLREYAKRFKADEDQWLFLTGDLTYIRRVGAEVFEVAAEEKFHTEKLILVDESGEISGYYSWREDREFEELKAEIRKMLARGKGTS
ncbi:SCO family protein [Candidatus Laterigemmans baculatus]|uniref:SCO family protein n=1 Tax=Candidatus Laterigemmans baculatus TaxID=2770505 RepID=UPI0013D94D34|nr:SCO family protein [Candidatus Laterigemmans baculatus]